MLKRAHSNLKRSYRRHLCPFTLCSFLSNPISLLFLAGQFFPAVQMHVLWCVVFVVIYLWCDWCLWDEDTFNQHASRNSFPLFRCLLFERIYGRRVSRAGHQTSFARSSYCLMLVYCMASILLLVHCAYGVAWEVDTDLGCQHFFLHFFFYFFVLIFVVYIASILHFFLILKLVFSLKSVGLSVRIYIPVEYVNHFRWIRSRQESRKKMMCFHFLSLIFVGKDEFLSFERQFNFNHRNG